ncbi:hypothetical protein [Campylobacter majalis]|nr:hypothetical protein [Campylobacter majalis]
MSYVKLKGRSKCGKWQVFNFVSQIDAILKQDGNVYMACAM